LEEYTRKTMGYLNIWCPGSDLNRHGVATEGF
jgi:hypothetical protein